MKIIALEGNDGSGKGLQFDLLKERLESLGKRCAALSFPQYDRFFGREIGAMLSGNNAARADNVDAKSMALWYAMDRWQAFQETDLAGADYLLLNRYTLSNAVYQSLRSQEPARGSAAQWEFAQWVFALEHDTPRLPRPDLYLLLDVDQALSRRNVAKKGYRGYTGHKPDVYESSADLLRYVHLTYLRFASLLDNVSVIQSMASGDMMPPDVIHNAIWETLQKNSFV